MRMAECVVVGYEQGVPRYQVIFRDMTEEEVREQRELEKSMREHMPPPIPTDTDRIEAQVMYTALMTDTLLIEEV